MTEATEVVEGEVLTEEQPRKRKVRRDRKVRDKMFVNAYFANGGNATKAAMEVGEYKSRQAAGVAGHLMKKRNDEEIERRMERYGLTEEKVMKRHADIIENAPDNVAMKGIDTYYKVTKKEGDNQGRISIQFHF